MSEELSLPRCHKNFVAFIEVTSSPQISLTIATLSLSILLLRNNSVRKLNIGVGFVRIRVQRHVSLARYHKAVVFASAEQSYINEVKSSIYLFDDFKELRRCFLRPMCKCQL